MVDFGGLVNKAKDLAAEHSDTVKDALNNVGEKIKEKTPDQFDGAVDQGIEKAGEYIGNNGAEEAAPAAEEPQA